MNKILNSCSIFKTLPYIWDVKRVMSKKKHADEAVKDASTEDKILVAARKIFTQKGYAATTVRDIAAEAEINVSLVNYYFRSKEKLFAFTMIENVNKLFERITPVLYDETASLESKIAFIAHHYIDMLIANPDFAIFVLNEVLAGSNKIPAVAEKRQLIQQSHFAKQVFALQAEGKISYHPLHILMNLLGLIFFPFAGRNLFKHFGVTQGDFVKMMEDRKQLIPVWVKCAMGR